MLSRLVICAALAFSACATPGPVLWNTEKPSVRATPEIASFEKRMFARLNQDRQKMGLPPLRYDEALADVARAHSLDMQRHGFFSHESPNTGMLEDRMDRAGYLAAEMRENLAMAPDIERAQDNLLKSPGHKRNIMADTISHVGVGIVRGDANGDDRMLVITQVFARPAKLATPAEAGPAVVRVLNAARQKAGLGPLTMHPMLTDLADKHIARLPDDVDPGAVSDIGDEVQKVLNDRDDHGLSSVQILGQAVFNADEFTVPDGVLDARSAAIGVAAAKATDERGRPRVKVLALVGRR